MKISEVIGDTSSEDDASLKTLDAREREGERRKQSAKVGKISVQLQKAQKKRRELSVAPKLLS